MSDDSQKSVSTLPGPIQLLTESAVLYKKYISVAFIALLPALIISFILIAYPSLSLWIKIPIWMIHYISFWYAGIVILLAVKENISVISDGSLFTKAFKILPLYAWTQIIYYLMAFGTIFPFVFPVLFFAFISIFIHTLPVLENTSGFDAFIRSREYVRNLFWPVVGRILALVGMTLGALFIYILLLFIAYRAGVPNHISILPILYILVLTPFSLMYHFSLYSHIKKIKPDVKTGSKTPYVLLAVWGIVAPTLLVGFLVIIMVVTAGLTELGQSGPYTSSENQAFSFDVDYSRCQQSSTGAIQFTDDSNLQISKQTTFYDLQKVIEDNSSCKRYFDEYYIYEIGDSGGWEHGEEFDRLLGQKSSQTIYDFFTDNLDYDLSSPDAEEDLDIFYHTKFIN